MALIDKRFVHFLTRNAFNTAEAAGEISNDSIVFVADEKRIWTHGKFYSPESFSKVIAGDKVIEAKDLYSTITFLAGDGLNISVDENGQITYAHNTKTVTGGNITTTAGKFISGITFDQFGHVASVSTADVEQNTYKNVVANDAADVEAEGAAIANGSVRINTVEHDSIANSDVVTSSVKIQGKDDIAVTALADGTIEVGHVLGQGTNMAAQAASEPTVDSIQALTSASVDAHGHLIALGSMPVPTKKYVDDKLGDLAGALDTSLILRGVIGSGDGMKTMEAANTAAEVGDIYKIGTAGTYAGQVCQVGDMIICVSKDPVEWVVIQANTDIASDQYLGLVKGGFTTSESARNFAVQIGTDGTMWVNVPFEYTNTSKSVVSNSATGQETASAGNGEVRINHLETSKNAAGTETTVVKSSVNIKGSDATTVKADADGVITVESHDTKYGMTYSETAASKTINLVEDGKVTATFTFDEWHNDPRQ